MKKIIVITALLSGVLSANAQFILQEGNNGYWGGDPTNNNYEQDVIGNVDVFDITGYRFETSGNDLTIQIHGNYFDDIMNNTGGLLGTKMGDLFISTDGLSWDTGGAATLTDYFGSGTETSWEYVVAIGNRTNADGALDKFLDSDSTPNADEAISTNVYAVDNNKIVLSGVNNGGIYREFQEVSYNGAGQNPEPQAASWFISDDYSFLGVTIENAGSLFGNSETIGFHWTMSCGNDVIEFEYATITPVPEPAQIGALGVAGMLGLLFVRRRLKKRKV